MIDLLHDRLVSSRRVRVLAHDVAEMLPFGARVLDIGCGDGHIDSVISEARPDIVIEGIDVLVRPRAKIPVTFFDGATIPFPSASFDVAMMIDVLHHTSEPRILLREAGRVASALVIKDHFREGPFAKTTLRVMDWVGNASHGVALPYNYWSKSEWQNAFYEIGMVNKTEVIPKLYSRPFCWIFGRQLHFLAKLTMRDTAEGAGRDAGV